MAPCTLRQMSQTITTLRSFITCCPFSPLLFNPHPSVVGTFLSHHSVGTGATSPTIACTCMLACTMPCTHDHSYLLSYSHSHLYSHSHHSVGTGATSPNIACTCMLVCTMPCTHNHLYSVSHSHSHSYSHLHLHPHSCSYIDNHAEARDIPSPALTCTHLHFECCLAGSHMHLCA